MLILSAVFEIADTKSASARTKHGVIYSVLTLDYHLKSLLTVLCVNMSKISVPHEEDVWRISGSNR